MNPQSRYFSGVFPQPNTDPKTGIHYGVIPSRDLGDGAFDEIVNNGVDVDYEEWKNCIREGVKKAIEEANNYTTDYGFGESSSLETFSAALKSYVEDYARIDRFIEIIDDDYTESVDDKGQITDIEGFTDKLLESILNEAWYEPSGDCTRYWYEQDGYKLSVASDGDIFVEESPYYTMASECAPTAPCAGYLRSEGVWKSFCLGAEWFGKGNDKWDHQIPYRCFRVADSTEVIAEQL